MLGVTLYGGLARGIIENCQLSEYSGRTKVSNQLTRTDNIVLTLGGNIYLGALLVLADDKTVLFVAARRHCIDYHLLALLVH